MTTQTLIWYTPEEKPTEDIDLKRLKIYYHPYDVVPFTGYNFSYVPTRWAYLDESVNVPVMFAEWINKNAASTSSLPINEWHYYDESRERHRVTTEQLFQEFLKNTMMNLLIPFADQSQSFAAGVEFGRLLAAMERGDEQIKNQSFPVRISNKQVITAACKAYGYMPMFGVEYYNEWVAFTGVKKEKLN